MVPRGLQGKISSSTWRSCTQAHLAEYAEMNSNRCNRTHVIFPLLWMFILARMNLGVWTSINQHQWKPIEIKRASLKEVLHDNFIKLLSDAGVKEEKDVLEAIYGAEFEILGAAEWRCQSSAVCTFFSASLTHNDHNDTPGQSAITSILKYRETINAMTRCCHGINFLHVVHLVRVVLHQTIRILCDPYLHDPSGILLVDKRGSVFLT